MSAPSFFVLAFAAITSLGIMPGTEAMLALQLERRSAPESHQLSLRDNTHLMPIYNNESMRLYTTNVTLGTPPQPLTVVVDTGSSDFWVFGAGSCAHGSADRCLGGTFDPSHSSSAHLNQSGGFEVQYGTPGSNVTGDYYTDTLNIAGVSVTQQIVGVAKYAKNVPTGILGLRCDTAYPCFLDMLKNEGIISARAFSMFLDDQQAAIGQVLLGGYDASKFNGELTIVNQEISPVNRRPDEYFAPWTGLSLTDSDGIITMYTEPDFQLSTLMDSGTSSLVLPDELYNAVLSHLSLPSGQGNTTLSCDIRNQWQGATLNFGFGGATSSSSGNGVVQIPIEELFVDAYRNGTRLADKSGNGLCMLGMKARSQASDQIFGDPFLRSAYVVFDYDNQLLGIAQTNFSASGDCSPQDIPSGGIASISGANVQTTVQIAPSATAFSAIETVTTSINAIQTSFSSLPSASAESSAGKRSAAGRTAAMSHTSAIITVVATIVCTIFGGIFAIVA